MTAATVPMNVRTAIKKLSGCSRQCFPNQRMKRLSGGLRIPMNTTGDAESFGMNDSSQCLAFHRFHQFMSALLEALGCVRAPSISQGRADTYITNQPKQQEA